MNHRGDRPDSSVLGRKSRRDVEPRRDLMSWLWSKDINMNTHISLIKYLLETVLPVAPIADPEPEGGCVVASLLGLILGFC
jgi:hypothetical protein